MPQIGEFTRTKNGDTGHIRTLSLDVEEMEARSLFVPRSGIVIYTQDCLQHHVSIVIHDNEPDHSPIEQMSGKPWTRIESAEVCFPSRRFTISSPSMPDPLPCGPVFFVDTAKDAARVSWMECQGSQDDSVPIEPDVIEITFWTR